MKILHITESFGGGVTTAINSYVKNSTQFDHYLFATVRSNDLTGEENNIRFKEIFISRRNLSFIFQLRSVIKTLKPNAVHIHSTYAGFICRLLPFISKEKIIFTPHGYSFLRNDNFLLLKLYYLIEKLLARRVKYIAACGREENNISEKYLNAKNVIELCNVCEPFIVDSPIKMTLNLPVIGMVGRISEQKGYDFFLETALQLKGKAIFKWIGGGNSLLENRMRDAGVEVTGWLNRDLVISHLAGLDLYFHSAAWEGFPISVLEASKLAKPILLRRIGAFDAENLFTVKDVTESVFVINRWLEQDSEIVIKLSQISSEINRTHTELNLQNSLDILYRNFKDN